ncbi:MAG: alpha/beta hydrolase family protein [Jatrophihabitantaceae bacterium]
MTITRRAMLAGTATALAACGRPSSHAVERHTTPAVAGGPVRHAYGSGPSQFGELSRPSDASKGTVVVIHGGFWRAQYDLSLGRPLAADLVHRGYTVWNLEYRRVGNGGGWPATFEDVAAGVDALAGLRVDTSHVVAIGHSAGGHLGAWAAGRGKLRAGAPGGRPRVAVTGVVSQAGVLELVRCADDGVGGTAAPDLMGGTPDQVPQRYRTGDPLAAVPLDAPVLCVHSKADTNVPYSQSVGYVAAATRAGGRATLHEVQGDHFTLIDPGSPAWAVVVAALPGLLAA